MVTVMRRRVLPDGRVEDYLPMLNKHGQYTLADRAVDPQHNKAVNQFFVDSIEAVVARLRLGGVSLRMKGSITGQPNLISAAEIQIVEDQDVTADEDPFHNFTEWASEADDLAYKSL